MPDSKRPICPTCGSTMHPIEPGYREDQWLILSEELTSCGDHWVCSGDAVKKVPEKRGVLTREGGYRNVEK